MLEVAVDTTDEETLREIESMLAGANPQRWPGTRDIGSIITLASSSVGLLNALLALKGSWSARSKAKNAQGGTGTDTADDAKRGVTIVIRNADREELRLEDVTDQTVQILISG